MSTNNLIVLESIVAQYRDSFESEISESEVFELFSFEQILKEYDLSYDELISGQVDGGDDGGIDGFFIFLEKELVNESLEDIPRKKNPRLELYLIQTKISRSFKEKPIETFISSAISIFDLDKNVDDLKSDYNSLLLEKISQLRDAYLKLAPKYPEISINYFYACKGDSGEIHQKLLGQAEKLQTIVKEKIYGTEFRFSFIGSRELLELSRKERSYSLSLKFLENYISRGEDNYVILASIRDYYDFVSDEKGNLRQYIFESNVRDYQGDIEVNKDIKKTLESDESSVDFWWLNNGITILVSTAGVSGKTINLEDVQIVNGLQTTRTIYEYMNSTEVSSTNINKSLASWNRQEERAILIKIIVANEDEVRDRVIKATNFQTPVNAASLRATEPIQRDIESFLYQNSWFYDRRKSYYRNIGKSPEKIVSIQYLAQIFSAVVYREPHNSKGRPTSLTKKDSTYNRIFSDKIDIKLYLYCVRFMKSIEVYLRSSSFHLLKQKHDFIKDSTIVKSLNFHLAMLVSVKMMASKQYKPTDIQKIFDDEVNVSLIEESVIELYKLTDKHLNSEDDLSLNKISKRDSFTQYLLENISFKN